ncbi:MAG: hypothetical protein COT84_05040 [Chlamydiae bacterium CG10_big_fil_rev_8_21_14_0_10_35_9]|nr:MAG: hypothetical protein COT84_05040 [Chlamydiae bacterium CG10_big_fil_rev_8_21_14_0_10_35_9]
MVSIVQPGQYIPDALKYDQRTFWQMSVDRAKTVANEVIFSLSRIPSYLSDVLGYNGKYHQLSKKHSWREENKGLYLLIHGVNGHPAAWDRHLSHLQKEHPSAEVLAPYVPFKGNCSLEKAATPLLHLVQDYVQTFPENPVCLIGVSNGARIAAYIETTLSSEINLKVSAIAGPFFGAKLINLAKTLRVASFFFTQEFIDEVAFGSAIARDLIEKMRESPEGRYEFFVTMDDSHVTPWTSGIPDLNNGEKVHICSGVGHNSIIDAVSFKQVQNCLAWMKKKD